MGWSWLLAYSHLYYLSRMGSNGGKWSRFGNVTSLATGHDIVAYCFSPFSANLLPNNYMRPSALFRARFDDTPCCKSFVWHGTETHCSAKTRGNWFLRSSECNAESGLVPCEPALSRHQCGRGAQPLRGAALRLVNIGHAKNDSGCCDRRVLWQQSLERLSLCRCLTSIRIGPMCSNQHSGTLLTTVAWLTVSQIVLETVAA